MDISFYWHKYINLQLMVRVHVKILVIDIYDGMGSECDIFWT